MSLPIEFMPNKDLKLEYQLELTLLSLLVWAEARGEPDEGKNAVAHVVMNRWKGKAWFGKSVRDVILKPYQFSCFNKNDPNRKKMLNVTNNDSWNKCFHAAFDAYRGFSEDPTGGATYYHASSCSPDWRNDFIQTRKIGNHIFYREK